MRRWLGIALLLLAGLALGPLQRLEVDNRLERWIEAEPQEEELYRRFQENFGSDEFLTITLYGEELLSLELFDHLLTIVEKLEILDGVVQVVGLPVLYRDLFEGEDFEELKREARVTPFYRGLLLSEDERALSLILRVAPSEHPRSRRELVQGVRRIVAPLEAEGLGADVVGSPALIVALDRLSEREVKRTFPLALVISLGILLLLFRSWRAMGIAALCAAVSVILSLALLQVAGSRLNMITSVLPPLIWVLALSGVVHILRRYQVHRGACSRHESRRRALRETTRPCTLAALTTALGFFSLLASVMAPVRELGLFAGLGILISLGVNLSLAPTLLRYWDLSVRGERRRTKHPRVLFLGADRPRTVLGVALALGLLGVFLLPRIVVESNPLLFLPEEHRTYQDYERVASTLGGFYTLEVILHLPLPWTDPTSWEAVDQLAMKLEAATPVAHVISPLNLLRRLNYWEESSQGEAYRLPKTREEAAARLDLLPEGFEDRLRTLVSEDGRTLRLSAVVNEMNENRFLHLVNQARNWTAALPPGMSGEVTGQVLRLVQTQQKLVSSQIRSLALAALVIFLALGIGLRSPRLLLLSVAPNLLPVLVAFGTMSLLGIPLDAATVMVASIALGIAVDDTVHLLVTIAREQKEGRPGVEPIRAALLHTGSALWITTAAAGSGFLALCFSSFRPLRYFGLLSTVALVTALLADLWLVPALLRVRRKRSADV